MAVFVKNKKGREVCLLNPSERGKKFAIELKSNQKITNSGILKRDKNGEAISLDSKARSYRAGYLAAQKDSARCYKYRLKKQ